MFNSFSIPKPDTGLKTIKSKQSGSLILTSSVLQTVTINTIDVNKSIITATYYPEITMTQDVNVLLKCRIIDSKTIEFSINTLVSGRSVTIAWEVIEFNNVKSLQKGDVSSVGLSSNVTINPVNINKIIYTVSYTGQAATTDIRSNFLQVSMINSTTLNLFNADGTFTKNVHWQIIEFY